MNFLKKAMEKTKATIETHTDSVLSRTRSSFKSNTYESGGTGTGESFLHGHLIIDIVAAKELPDMESWLAKLVKKNLLKNLLKLLDMSKKRKCVIWLKNLNMFNPSEFSP